MLSGVVCKHFPKLQFESLFRIAFSGASKKMFEVLEQDVYFGFFSC